MAAAGIHVKAKAAWKTRRRPAEEQARGPSGLTRANRRDGFKSGGVDWIRRIAFGAGSCVEPGGSRFLRNSVRQAWSAAGNSKEQICASPICRRSGRIG